MYDLEHKTLFEAIRAGKTINDGDYMCTSSMLAILAEMACCTGQQITWDQALNSDMVLGPQRVAWDAEPPVKPEPMASIPRPCQGSRDSGRVGSLECGD